MNFNRVIEASYKCLSLKNHLWFLLLFWIAFPILVIVPWAMEKGLFGLSLQPLVLVLYEFIYVAVIFGFVALTTVFLFQKKLGAPKVTLKKFLLTFPLVFVELWYLFVWNLKDKYFRFTQLLLVLGIPLLFFYYLTVPSTLIYYSLVIFLFAYILLLIYNFTRLMFTVPIFYSKNVSIFEAPKESWYLTHNKFDSILIALMFALGLIVIMFFLISIVLAIIANFVLSYFFINRISYELSLRGAYLFALAPIAICYYSAITEIFSQLLRERESSSRIKNILARRVFSKKIKKKVLAKSKSKGKIKKKRK